MSSNTSSAASSLQKTRSKPFRKPFEAYAKAPHYTTAKTPEIIREAPKPRPRRDSARKDSPRTIKNLSQESIHRAASPAEARGYDTRAASPAPPMNSYAARAPSPGPPRLHHYASRAPSPAPPPPMPHHYVRRTPSPAPSHLQDHDDRTPSPAPPIHRYPLRVASPAPSFGYAPSGPGAEVDSPPPPPPPPHRHAINRNNSNASYDNRPPQTGYHTPRMPSPCPSPGIDGHTPSPLREAMDGVIEQLDALGMKGDNESAEVPFDPWSPESFDMVHHRSRRKAQTRSQTSLGMPHQDSGYESHGGESSQEQQHHEGFQEEPPLPQLNNYVERMESRLRKMHQHSSSMGDIDLRGINRVHQHNSSMGGVDSSDVEKTHQHSSSMGAIDHRETESPPPPVPPKGHHHERPKSSLGQIVETGRRLRKQKSFYEIGGQLLGRTSTTKTNSTNASSSTTTQSTNKSLMSGASAGGISATSAGSLARKNERARSALGIRDGNEDEDPNRPITPFSGVSYHPSHSTSALRPQSQAALRPQSQATFHDDGIAGIGGLVQPEATKPKKSNFIRRILEATKTGVASGRSSIAINSSPAQSSAVQRTLRTSMASIAGPSTTNLTPTPRDMALTRSSSNNDWMQVRRDVNRSNTLSKKERSDRRDRCLMMDYPALDPVDELYESVEGDEGADGLPVHEPTNYQAINLSQVDKNSRFLSNLPSSTTSITLATTYVCRPYRSDVQRLRAIFTWAAEKIHWEEDFEGEIDTRRVIQTKRGCAEEYAVLVHEMCAAVGIQSEIVRGYLKSPGEIPETTLMPRSNHWWNAVVVDNEWRMMDCCLASPSNPRRALYSSAANTTAEFWWFLTRPLELCWTHIPEHHSQQHICPPVAHETLLNLPCACPPYFKNGLAMVDYNTSLIRIEDLEMVHINFNVPADIEVAAEVEVRGYTRDSDGDFFENGEVVRKRALVQAEWYNGVKRYTVKAILPGDEGNGTLKVYAGKRGLMHSIKDIPHPLAFALPIIHTGENPPYEFVTRHPTPHAQRHDIYVVQPQCQRLALNNTFVFAVRQHPALPPSPPGAGAGGSAMTPSSNPGATSPVPPFARPASAMSMVTTSSVSASAAPSSATGTIAGKKPAKLAVQTPGGKILRLMRKDDRSRGGAGLGIGVGGGRGAGEDESSPSGAVSDGGTWETIIKCSERGVWRGLVLADRTARWCVFAEWVCVG
ncbi:hypothetical protein DL762_005544 [Monosporascus cannonballus]|uniref:Transglutaminase-like domain-containing protein n=1 Tax=Monosporascus cannonballus TaxID=155416 RepID=A0ABY0H4K0_9PEZI|nr:hypothetical protein DL762_005544 [Monosporascus cannonballus]